MLHTLLSVLAQESTGDATAGLMGGTFGALFGLVIAVLAIAGLWKVFSKAGRPGWAAIIPLYNIYVILKIVGRPGWWLILMFIPLVNIVIWIIVCLDLAKSFGKGAFLWGIILLFFLNVIGYLLLGFGDAKYLGPAAAKP
jgi:hypothetical protein